MNRRVLLLATILLGLSGCFSPQNRGQAPDDMDRLDADLKAVKIVGDVAGDIGGGSIGTPISGVGLVGGLEGTGGGVPPGDFRRMLEDQLLKKGVQNVKELLASSNYTMVLVNTVIPVGTRKGDKVDVEVTLPQGSRATSLRGGYLYECPMMDYQTQQSKQGATSVLKGHILAKAGGPLFIDFGDAKEEGRLRKALIWGGAVSHIDSPFVLFLKNDNNFASVANTVANRINMAFPDDAQKQFLAKQKRLLVADEIAGGINQKFHAPNGMGRGETAHASGSGGIQVNVPLEYALNPERFRRVLHFIPLRDTPEVLAKYRKQLQEMLLEPKDTVFAALRLEALGKDSIPALQRGLASDNTLVRFASAESLTYLGSTTGVEELARLAEKHETLRGSCCLALASLNESVTRTKLTGLLQSTEPQVRMGAFRALLSLAESNPQAGAALNGELLNDTFWLHGVAPSSSPLVHIATRRRAEIVIFGEAPVLLPPLRVLAGQFTIIAEAGDNRCTISRYVDNAANPMRKQCSFKLEDIVRTMAGMGGQYPDVARFLHEADEGKHLNCLVATDALPLAVPLDLLAACGSDASRFKDDPEKQQEVLAAQGELGLVVGAKVGPGQR